MWWHFLSGSILCSHSNLLELWEVCEEEMEPTRPLLSYGLQWSVGRTKMASLVCKEEMEPARLLLSYGLRWSVGRTKMASLVCFLKIQKTRRKGRYGLRDFGFAIFLTEIETKGGHFDFQLGYFFGVRFRFVQF
nr:hypothetical protein Iba_chr04cCG13620 [Ipomoea batatas]